MAGKLDWKWIGIGVVIMFALSLVAGMIAAMTLGSALPTDLATDPAAEEIVLSGGQMAFLAVLNLLSFLIGGFIVGLKSTGRTILEPGISAAIAVLLALIISGNFSLGGLLAGGLVPFAAGVLGGWLGERRQAAA